MRNEVEQSVLGAVKVAGRHVVRIALALAMLASAGCSGSSHMTGFEYVHRIGPPKAIGEWALRQTDNERVIDALVALKAYPLSWNISQRDKSDAIEALLAIANKCIEGWPSLTEEDRSRRASSVYDYFAGDGRYSPILHETFLRIRPSPNDEKRHALWHAALEDARKMYKGEWDPLTDLPEPPPPSMRPAPG